MSAPSPLKEKISKVLVAVDGSEESMRAADHAIAIAQKDDAELAALYVVTSPTGYDYTSNMPEDQIPEAVKNIIQNAKQESQPWLNKISEKAIAASNTRLKTEVILDTSITGSIVDYAERENIDLIVIGTRGRSAFKRLLLGSTALGVVTYAHCPVMVVK